ncbi:amino acid adenylation domain-containing protein [Thioclava sp. GXIMD4216]|uniref:amino acid adenylation domain-containing protein n=1 Tax=Thioclava sp. GXIMD4216 TaxID=3131929 RepID=UPI0030CDE7BD
MKDHLSQDSGVQLWSPLTEAQEGIWYAQARMPHNPAFMTGQALHLHGPLDRAQLEAALAELGQEAHCLSLRFRQVAGQPEQSLDPALAPRLQHITFDTPPSEADLRTRLLAEARRPLDLARDPLASFTLWQITPQHHILTERIHHLAADGRAMVEITQRLAQLYNARITGQPAGTPLPPLARAFEEDARFRASPARASQHRFWQEKIRLLPEVEDIAARGGQGDGTWFHRHELPLSAELCADLAQLAHIAGVHWTDVLVGLAGAWLGRHLPLVSRGESDEVVIGLPLQNRMGKLARVPSTQVNVLPLALRVQEDAPLGDWLQEVGRSLAEMRRNLRYRGELLAREAGRIGAGRRLWGPLINILPFEACPTFSGCTSQLQILSAGSVEDLTICYRGTPETGLLLQIDANDARYSAEETETMTRRLGCFLARAALAPQLRLVPTLTAEETQVHLVARNQTAHPLPETTLWDLIAMQIARSPDACALRFGDQAVSYRQLDARTEALAQHLAALGAGPGQIIAVALPRSVELVVALLAVIRAGAAYVPLDPEDQSARSAGILAQVAPLAVIAQDGYPCGDCPQIDWPQIDWPQVDWQHVSPTTTGGPDKGTTPRPAGPDDLAYVLFTSGSTGAPKGVMIEHRAIVNRLLWMRETYGFGPADRILQKTPATFDVSVWEFFLPFLCGASLVVAPPGAHRDPVALAGIIRREKITTLHFVPSMLELFLAAPASEGLTIARVFASGEALPTRLARLFAQRISGALHNLYGPTEAAVDVTYAPADPAQNGPQIPIGHPVWNTGCYVLDHCQRPVPDGLAGRLYLAGGQLARGYLGRPDLTKERFVPNPFPAAPFSPKTATGTAIMYDTGDLVTADAQGSLTFAGRVDHQIKIRGVRIEPAEIEARMAQAPCLKQVAMIVDQDATGQARLLAYVVPREDASAADIRKAFETALPAMMQPAHILTLPALPLNSSGKLDRKALPAPQTTAGETKALPRAGTETLLSRLYAEILGLPEPVDRKTDFFLAGGESLRAVRLSLRIEEETGRDPGLGVLLEHPVLADLAEVLDQGANRSAAPQDHGTKPVLRLQKGAPTGPVIFAIHPAGGLAWCYRRLAQSLPEATVYGLQSPLLEHGGPLQGDLNALARSYLDEIAALWPREGKVYLLGWSLGGIIAHAMAAEAERRGWPLARLVLMDAYPSACWRDQPEPDDGTALRAILAIAGFDPEAHRHLETVAEVTGFLAARQHPLAQLPAAILAGVMRSVRATNRLVRDHHEPQVHCPTLHLAALRDQIGQGGAQGQGGDPQGHHAGLWDSYCQTLERMEFDCHHPDMIGPEVVEALAGTLRLPSPK